MRRGLIIGALCALLATCAPVRASATCESDALLLARICVSEAGWSAHESGDCGAIAYTITATSSERAISFRAAARAHSPRATGARETADARLSWVAGTAEVVRVATDGTRNACSMLYGAAWRACRALGYRRLVTYTLPEEGGASLRAAGWRLVGEAGGGSWSRKSRPRVDLHPTQQKMRWEAA